MIKHITYLLLYCITFSLCVGCSYFSHHSSNHNSHITPITLEKHPIECDQTIISNTSCPYFKYQSIQFKNNKTLNALIEKKLLQLAQNPSNLTLQAYWQNYLLKANPGDHLTLSTRLLTDNKKLITLKLTVEESHSTDVYTPTKTIFINFDKDKQQDISLKDMMYPEKIQAFWTTAQLAYNNWLEINQLLNHEAYRVDWPFIHTPHIALLAFGVLLQYEPNTLAPYAMGEPTLLIPYKQLNNIIRPEYIFN